MFGRARKPLEEVVASLHEERRQMLIEEERAIARKYEDATKRALLAAYEKSARMRVHPLDFGMLTNFVRMLQTGYEMADYRSMPSTPWPRGFPVLIVDSSLRWGEVVPDGPQAEERQQVSR